MEYFMVKKFNEYNSYKHVDVPKLQDSPLITIRGHVFSIEEICNKYPKTDYEIEIYNTTQDYLENLYLDINKAYSILSEYNFPLNEIDNWIKKYPKPKERVDYNEFLPENIYLNLSKNLLEYVELCSVNEIEKFREFNRNDEFSLKKKSEIKKDILENGIKESLIIEYSSTDKKALLTEGNHRLDVIKDLDLKYYPVRVITTNNKLPKGIPVTGYNPKKHGFIPYNLKPSQIGIKPTFNVDSKLI